MNYEFRNNLLQTNEEFKTIFNKLKSENKITDYTREIWSIIEKDKTPIKMQNNIFTLKDLFEKNLTSGRCRTCAYELVMLLNKLGYFANAVYCMNKYIKGTIGSKGGGHWYVEAYINGKVTQIDTSLMIISNGNFNLLGYEIIEKETLNDILRKNIDLRTYYDNMVIEPVRKK